MLLLRGVAVIVVSLYLADTVGAAGVNLQRLAQVKHFLQSNRSYPFVIVGDFNLEPEDLQQTVFLKSVCAEVVTCGKEATCYSGRLLDFVVVSRSFRPAIEVTEEYWSPPETFDKKGAESN